jgi:hypothetical protein
MAGRRSISHLRAGSCIAREFDMYTMVRFAVSLGFLLFMVRVMDAQSNTWELTAKYGPLEIERYRVTPEVSLTVAYGRDRTVCQLLVEPRTASVLETAPTREPPTISADLADDLLNELLPLGVRQGEARAMVEQMGCPALLSEDYDNVRITRAINDCAPAAKNVTSMAIQWKRPECPARNRTLIKAYKKTLRPDLP